jgi:hypothetical protein
MTDDIIEDGERVVFRQNLWRRFVQIGAGIAVIGLCLTLFIMAPGMENPLLWQACSLLAGIFFVYALYKAATNPRVTLIAGRDGLQPKFGPVEKQILIPWSNINRLDEAVQKFKGNTTSYLAIYLNDAAGYEGSMLDQISAPIAQRTLSDGGTAQIYIPGMMLPASVKTVIARLEALRNKKSIA